MARSKKHQTKPAQSGSEAGSAPEPVPPGLRGVYTMWQRWLGLPREEQRRQELATAKALARAKVEIAHTGNRGDSVLYELFLLRDVLSKMSLFRGALLYVALSGVAEWLALHPIVGAAEGDLKRLRKVDAEFRREYSDLPREDREGFKPESLASGRLVSAENRIRNEVRALLPKLAELVDLGSIGESRAARPEGELCLTVRSGCAGPGAEVHPTLDIGVTDLAGCLTPWVSDLGLTVKQYLLLEALFEQRHKAGNKKPAGHVETRIRFEDVEDLAATRLSEWGGTADVGSARMSEERSRLIARFRQLGLRRDEVIAFERGGDMWTPLPPDALTTEG
ncbi:MAG: hypothetical protein HY903_11530 [Deltaproteobacteria bacterium]|nr:hypothetical protein [Deltaproteobacteria bacterium]